MIQVTLGSVHISFLPNLDHSLALTILFLAVVGTLLLAFKTLRNRAHYNIIQRYSMVAVNILSVVSLLLLLSDIQIASSQPRATVMVTAGTQVTELQQIKERHTVPDERIYWLIDSEGKGNQISGRRIHGVEQLAILEKDLGTLIVLGEGLSQSQWQTLDTLSQHPFQVDFIPAPLPSGLINMNWRTSVVLGETVKLSGQIAPSLMPAANLAASIFTVVLRDPGGQEVSRRRVKAGSGFEMSFAPPSAGRWLYQLSLLNHQDQEIEQQSLAISVRKGDELTLLIRQSAPSFETRAVKDWFSQTLGSVRIETQIGQQKWMAQNIRYTGLESSTSSILDSLELLQRLDLVILDGRALNSLQPLQRENLAQAIEQGLGLLVLADPSLIADDAALQLFTDLRVQGDQQTDTKTTRLSWDGMVSDQLMSVFAATISGTPQWALVIGKPDSKTLLAMQKRGLGSIGLSLVGTTYQWPTQGETGQFDRYWQYVIQQLARPLTQSNWLENSLPNFSQIFDTLTPCAMVSGQNPESATLMSRYSDPAGHSVSIPLESSTLDPMRRCSVIKPARSGWYQLQLGDGATPQSTLDHYVYDSNQWQNWQQHEKHQASRYRQSRNNRASMPTAYRSLDKWLLWSSFIVLCSLLWWEQKRLRQSR